MKKDNGGHVHSLACFTESKEIFVPALSKEAKLSKARERVMKEVKRWRIGFGSTELALIKAVDSLLKLEGKK